LALLFVCKKFNYSFKIASDNILKQRPCALTNSTYKEQVIEYIKNDYIKNHANKLMGDLGKNSLWSDIENGASNVETDLLGPSYSYADNIPAPSSLGIGTDGSFSQLGTNMSGIGTYVSALIDGDPPLGNRVFCKHWRDLYCAGRIFHNHDTIMSIISRV